MADRQRLLNMASKEKSEVVWLGLHACGGLTDIILELFCAAGGSFIVCPCCFNKHRDIHSDCFWRMTEVPPGPSGSEGSCEVTVSAASAVTMCLIVTALPLPRARPPWMKRCADWPSIKNARCQCGRCIC